MEAKRAEKTEAVKIEMEVVQVHSLPEKFRPSPSSRAPATEDVPGPLAELIREATSGLTGPEREVFLRRLREKHPGLFSGETGGDGQEPPEGLLSRATKERKRILSVQLSASDISHLLLGRYGISNRSFSN